LVNEAELTYPDILTSNGTVMDGMYQVAIELFESQTTILAKKFHKTLPPALLKFIQMNWNINAAI
jgi:hypothetical protein